MSNISRLIAGKTALAVIDMQEAFRAVIADFAETAERIGKAVQGAHALGVPVIVTEQYPKGLKRTAPEIATHLNGAVPIEKMSFSSCGVAPFIDQLRAAGTQTVMVVGIEAHICVTQTTLDLLEQGFSVHLLEDCITSRNPRSKKMAFKRLLAAGAVASNLEMALFELMRTAEAPQFKTIQNLVR
jgi:nicotinamidase-related amidase